MSKKLKLDFYTFKIERIRESEGRTSAQVDILSLEDSINYFLTIRNTCRDMGNNRLSIKLPNGNFADILSFENNQAYIRIGNPNPKSTLTIRNSNTLQSHPLSIEENQQIETFTFFFMDFNTGYIAHLYLQNAPRLSSIKELFRRDRAGINFSVILNEQTLQEIVTKDMVCSIRLKVAVPSSDVLESLSLSANHFRNIEDLKTKDVEFNFSAGRNKNLFNQASDFRNFYNGAVNRFTEVKKFRISAKNEGEKTEVYDLVNSKFTKSVTFEVDNINSVSEQEYMHKIFEKYTEALPEIRRIVNTR